MSESHDPIYSSIIFSIRNLSKSKTFISGCWAVVSTWVRSEHGFVVQGYIAEAGTHIVSVPAVFTATPAEVILPVNAIIALAAVAWGVMVKCVTWVPAEFLSLPN